MGGIRRIARGARLVLGAFMGLLATAAPAAAQDFGLVTTLVHPNQRPNNEDRFGSALAISGGTLFVGAKDEGGANAYSGVVHVFSDADWSEVQLKSSVDADFEFGASIQVDGDRALISNGAIDYGVVWFFEKVAGVWTEKLRIQGLVDEAFGSRLALRGDFAVVAAPRVGTGNVHVYQRIAGTWREVQLLTPSDALAEDYFGYSIAFEGQRLAVGAPGTFLGPKRSSVYTFSKDGDAFVQDGKLAGDDPASHWFGAAVGMSGDTLIVNAPPPYQATSRGKALVYDRHGEQWELEGELTVDGEASFPGGLAMDQDAAWLGASTTDPPAQNIYAFKRTNGTWRQAQKLNFPIPGEYEIASFTYRDGTLAVGFWNGLRTESVQVYRAPGHESSNGGGSPGGTAGAGLGSASAGNTNAGGTSGESSADRNAAAGVGSDSDPSGSGGDASNEPASAGRSTDRGTSERGGCTLVSISNAPAWPVAVLAFALALTRNRRSRRVARSERHAKRSAATPPTGRSPIRTRCQ